jgi:hypothetical protein
VAVGDFVQFNIPASLNTGLAYVGCRISAGDTVQISLANLTGGSINDGSLTWSYCWYDLT